MESTLTSDLNAAPSGLSISPGGAEAFSSILLNYIDPNSGDGAITDAQVNYVLRKSFDVQANMTLDRDCIIVIKPGLAAGTVGHIWLQRLDGQGHPAGWQWTQDVQLPFDLSSFAGARVASSVFSVFSDTISTTNVALAGRASTIVVNQLPTDLPDYGTLSAKTPVDTYRCINYPLHIGSVFTSFPRMRKMRLTRASLPDFRQPIKPKGGVTTVIEMGEFASIQTVYESGYNPYNSGSLRLQFDGTLIPQSDGVNRMVVEYTVFGVAGSRTLYYPVAFSDEGGPLPTIELLISGQDIIREVKIQVVSAGGAAIPFRYIGDVTSYRLDPVNGDDGEEISITYIQGVTDARNLIVTGKINFELNVTPQIAPQVALAMLPMASWIPIECYRSLLRASVATGVRLVYTRNQFAQLMTHVRELVSPAYAYNLCLKDPGALTSLGVCGIADFWKGLISKVKSWGIQPADLVRKGLIAGTDLMSQPFGLIAKTALPIAMEGVDALEKRGFLTTSSSFVPNQVPPGPIAYCSTDPKKRPVEDVHAPAAAVNVKTIAQARQALSRASNTMARPVPPGLQEVWPSAYGFTTHRPKWAEPLPPPQIPSPEQLSSPNWRGFEDDLIRAFKNGVYGEPMRKRINALTPSVIGTRREPSVLSWVKEHYDHNTPVDDAFVSQAVSDLQQTLGEVSPTDVKRIALLFVGGMYREPAPEQVSKARSPPELWQALGQPRVKLSTPPKHYHLDFVGGDDFDVSSWSPSVSVDICNIALRHFEEYNFKMWSVGESMLCSYKYELTSLPYIVSPVTMFRVDSTIGAKIQYTVTSPDVELHLCVEVPDEQVAECSASEEGSLGILARKLIEARNRQQVAVATSQPVQATCTSYGIPTSNFAGIGFCSTAEDSGFKDVQGAGEIAAQLQRVKEALYGGGAGPSVSAEPVISVPAAKGRSPYQVALDQAQRGDPWLLEVLQTTENSNFPRVAAFAGVTESGGIPFALVATATKREKTGAGSAAKTWVTVESEDMGGPLLDEEQYYKIPDTQLYVDKAHLMSAGPVNNAAMELYYKSFALIHHWTSPVYQIYLTVCPLGDPSPEHKTHLTGTSLHGALESIAKRQSTLFVTYMAGAKVLNFPGAPSYYPVPVTNQSIKIDCLRKTLGTVIGHHMTRFNENLLQFVVFGPGDLKVIVEQMPEKPEMYLTMMMKSFWNGVGEPTMEQMLKYNADRFPVVQVESYTYMHPNEMWNICMAISEPVPTGIPVITRAFLSAFNTLAEALFTFVDDDFVMKVNYDLSPFKFTKAQLSRMLRRRYHAIENPTFDNIYSASNPYFKNWYDGLKKQADEIRNRKAGGDKKLGSYPVQAFTDEQLRQLLQRMNTSFKEGIPSQRRPLAKSPDAQDGWASRGGEFDDF